MKDTFYFTHDYNARTDDKIKLLIRKHGMLGYGIFWAIIEDLYNNANALRLDYEGIAFELRVDEKIVFSIINDFKLFNVYDFSFSSLSVERRLNERNEKSLKAKESALKRWNKDANALRTQSEGNAIKEIKGKEIKEKKGNIINNNFTNFSNPEHFQNWLFENITQEYKEFLCRQTQTDLNDIDKLIQEWGEICTKTGKIYELGHTGALSYLLNWINKKNSLKKNNGINKNGFKQNDLSTNEFKGKYDNGAGL